MTLAVSTRGLTKRYRSRIAVDSLDLEVPLGSVFGFLGPNGAGKTTTIRMLLGLAHPTSGSAMVLGHRVPGQLSKVATATASVLEDPSFYPQMSARKNLEVLALISGDRVALRNIDESLAQVKLMDRADDKVGRYSRGMRQRLALAAALIGDPDLYILDEPATGLDPPGVRDVRDLLLMLKESGKTVFFSSHSLSEVERVCDIVAFVKQGKVVQSGNLDALMATGPAVRVVVDQTALASDVATKRGWTARTEGDAIIVEGVSSEEVNIALVSAGIHPQELSLIKPSLEELFLDVTSDDGD